MSEMYCEMCGAPIKGRAYRVTIEGATMILCGRCYAKISASPGSAVPVNVQSAGSRKMLAQKKTVRRHGRVEYEVVDDYADRIRNARVKMGWTIAALARRVMERESVLKRIESGKLRPTIDLAKKLEKVLGITLLEPVVEELGEAVERGGRVELTLGDLANIRVRGKNE